jgi:acyl transferase domain-containing protein
LPTYPFAKERYWIQTNKDVVPEEVGGTIFPIHPLLQENRSTFLNGKFRSTFKGDEFFLRDHLVNGQKMLPDAAYLEMVREAIEIASENPEAMICLQNISFGSPMLVNRNPQTAAIDLFLEENEEIVFEVYTVDTEVIHCQGTAFLKQKRVLKPLDLVGLQAKPLLRMFSKLECYEAFEKIGVWYGPSYQVVESLWIFDSGVLAKLTLPSALESSLDSYRVHPSLLDGALQSSIGLFFDQLSSIQKPLQLFSLESLDIFGGSTSSMWSWLRPSDGEALVKKQQVDIDLCDDRGNVMVQMRRGSFQAVEDNGMEKNQS